MLRVSCSFLGAGTLIGDDIEAGDVADVALVSYVGPAESALVEQLAVAVQLKQAEAQVAVVSAVDCRIDKLVRDFDAAAPVLLDFIQPNALDLEVIAESRRIEFLRLRCH